jgi:nicotinamidase-related amidase
MQFSAADTAVLITDPQNDVLREGGVAWDLIKESLKANNTVENLENLLGTAKERGYLRVISPHYYYPSDKLWKFGGPIETMMHESNMFGRVGPLTTEGFAGSGADWLESLAPIINDGETIICNPHKVFGPGTNDVVVQLRKRGISKVIIGGMLGNLCMESHLRELLENGFQVAAAKDATASPVHPELGDGNVAAQISFAFLANATLSTKEAVAAM